MATLNYRTINIDLLDPESPANFDLSTLHPLVTPVSTTDIQNTTAQIRQLLRGGDSDGALRGALENAPYGGDAGGKVGKICYCSACCGKEEESVRWARSLVLLVEGSAGVIGGEICQQAKA